MKRVAVIGLGRIGSANDHGAPAGCPPRSHAGAVVATPGLELAALVDPDAAARAAALARWGIGQAVAEVADLPAGIDVAVLCTPSALRRPMVEALLDKGIGLLIVEKPLALDLAEARRIAMLVQQRGAELRVNFHRRFDPRLARLKQDLAGTRPRLAVMRYGKGLYNYGSHLVDLVLDWFGPVAEVQAIGAERPGADPTLSFRCGLAAGFDAMVLGMDGLAYDQFEIELYLPDQRIELVAGGVEHWSQRPQADRFYPGYAHLGPAAALAPSGPVSGLAELWAEIARAPSPAGCTAAEALAGMEILSAARLSAARGGVTLTTEQWQ